MSCCEILPKINWAIENVTQAVKIISTALTAID
jgi:hypothetical protein